MMKVKFLIPFQKTFYLYIDNVSDFHLDSEVGNVKKASSEKVVNKENASQMTSNAIFKPPVST